MIITTAALAARILSNPFSNVFQKRLTESGHNPLAVNAVSYLLLSLLCVVPALGVDWASLPTAFWLCAISGGLFGAVGNGFLVKALQGGDLSILGPVNSYKSVVGIVVSIVLLGELPSLAGLLGVAIIIGGSYFVFDTTDEGFSWGLLRDPSLRYRLYAMVLTAIEAVIIKKVIFYSDTTTSFIVWCWFGALFALVQAFVSDADPVREISETKGRGWAAYAALVFCIGLMQFSTNFVFSRMNVGYALALFQLSTIVSVLLGYKLFHERSIAKKLTGSAIMIAGSVIIIFS